MANKMQQEVFNLTPSNNFEVHEDWLYEIRRKLRTNYGDVRQFSVSNNIDYFATFWFFKGNPVERGIFKAICDVLDLDWERIQHPYADVI